MIKLKIDGKEVEARPGTTVLNAALGAGIYIPHLCDHPDLKPAGACRLCLVELEGMEGVHASCHLRATEGIEVRTATPRILHLRRMAMELLLADHPEECSTCTKYLNCELQSLKQFTGVSEHLSVRRRPKRIPPDVSHPLFNYDFERCINCGRCVRACNELRGAEVLKFVHRGEENSAGIAVGQSWEEAGCRFCGACVEVCPTAAIMDKPELVKGKKRRDALVPCRANCPAEIDTMRYVRYLGEGKIAEAAAVIREKVPLPLILGYVCVHPCEDVCRRKQVNNSPISLRELKRFAIEHDTLQIWKQKARHESSTGKRVAVVGSGPAGLTAAYYLAKLGHEAVIFEELPEPGGMLRYGIPEYRLPRAVIAREIEEICEAGVEIRTGTKIESLSALIDDEDFDAVVVAAGAHKGGKLRIPGKDLPEVYDAISFLRSVNLGTPYKVGKRLAVIGGGSVAFDCARVARRLGAEEIHVACLEPRDKMLAAQEEIDEGVEEGIVLHPSHGFYRILDEAGHVTGIECRDVATFAFEDGKLQVEYAPGSDHVIQADTVIFAIGQKPEIPEDFDVELTSRGLIEVDEYTLETSEDGIFAAGDVVMGTASVIKAIASARRTASAVDKYLGGNGNIEEKLAPDNVWDPWIGKAGDFAGRQRQLPVLVDPAERVQSFCVIDNGFNEMTAMAEAGRCLNCNLRLKMSPVKFWGDY
jgi:NADPH-dependent glutamate synthase beta subunit-like oxidoreductase/ferredoxin/Pyruvate/2-oxoacid:ferredoxin oxidoreductase delta subunit